MFFSGIKKKGSFFFLNNKREKKRDCKNAFFNLYTVYATVQPKLLLLQDGIVKSTSHIILRGCNVPLQYTQGFFDRRNSEMIPPDINYVCRSYD